MVWERLIQIGFSRPNKVLLNGMASEKLKFTSNLLRNEKRI